MQHKDLYPKYDLLLPSKFDGGYLVIALYEKIKNRDELMEYVPESLVKLYWYDKEHDGELIETLQAYLDCDKSANKAAEKLYVNYRTLSSRLKKIKDISGIDFKNSAEMLAVRNGIVLFKMAETL